MSVAGLAIAGVGLGDQIGLQIHDLIASTGCGTTCTTASAIANTAETLGRIITSRYFGLPAPRTLSEQRAALSDADAVVNWAIQQCSSPALGDAGQRCINERYVQGATAPWCPTGSGCDFITLVRDPIADDPVIDDSANPVNQFVPVNLSGTAAPYGPFAAGSPSIFSGSTILPGVSNGLVLFVGFVVLLIISKK